MYIIFLLFKFTFTWKKQSYKYKCQKYDTKFQRIHRCWIFSKLKICSFKKTYFLFIRIFYYLNLATVDPLLFLINVEICTTNFIFSKANVKKQEQIFKFGAFNSDVKNRIPPSTKQLLDTKYSWKRYIFSIQQKEKIIYKNINILHSI